MRNPAIDQYASVWEGRGGWSRGRKHFTSSTAGDKSGIFPQACSSHVKAILITILPVTLLTLDCRSLNYIWARIPPFHSGLLNTWTGIDLVVDSVSEWFLQLAAQEVASLAEVQKEGSPSTFLSPNPITMKRIKVCMWCALPLHVSYERSCHLQQLIKDWCDGLINSGYVGRSRIPVLFYGNMLVVLQSILLKWYSLLEYPGQTEHFL